MRTAPEPMTEGDLSRSSSGRSSRLRTPRGRRGAAAVLTAVVALAICVFAAVEAIALASHRRTIGFDVRSVARWARDTAVGDRVVLVVAVVATCLGAVLLLAAAVPARRRLTQLADTDPSIAVGLTRRSLRRTLSAVACSVDGISNATVSGGRRLTVTATTSLRNTGALPGRVRDRVTARLDELEPQQPHSVRIRLRRKDR